MPPSIRPPAREPDRRPRAAVSAHAICDRVAIVVAQDFAVDRASLFARTRSSPRDALARQTAMYLVHTVFAMSLGQVGRIYGRDRTTVAHACRRIEDARESQGFDERLRRLELRCRRPQSGGGPTPRVSLMVVR
ncbi:MAG: helix-turn-helix domain-containing protein [Pseudomonadota bacterium]